MRRSFSGVLSFAALALACAPEAGALAPAEAGNAAEQAAAPLEAPARCGLHARQLLAEGALLLDVRTPEEYAAGHIEGAQNVPLQELASRAGELPRVKTIVAYCRSGARAQSAATQLEELGHSVYVLGGMGDWDNTDC